jgi:hypothetical protein
MALAAKFLENVDAEYDAPSWWISLSSLESWSHPPGLNRRPADYEKYAPAPNVPLALYGSA